MLQKIRASKSYKYLLFVSAVVGRKRIDVYSACSAFYIFISFIPFALILLSTVKYLPFSKQDLLDFTISMLPAGPNELTVQVIDELYERGVGTLSISVIAAIWASAKGVLGITKGLNEINDVASTRNFLYLRARSAVCTLLLMLGMILMLVISVFGNAITDVIRRFVIIPQQILSLIAWKNLIMFGILFVVFMFLFCVLPDTRIRIRTQITGAAAAAFVWILFTKLFSFYLSTFNGYSMYGGFAVVLVTGVWLYAGMYIMFMGALLNSYLASRKGKGS